GHDSCSHYSGRHRPPRPGTKGDEQSCSDTSRWPKYSHSVRLGQECEAKTRPKKISNGHRYRETGAVPPQHLLSLAKCEAQCPIRHVSLHAALSRKSGSECIRMTPKDVLSVKQQVGRYGQLQKEAWCQTMKIVARDHAPCQPVVAPVL